MLFRLVITALVIAFAQPTLAVEVPYVLDARLPSYPPLAISSRSSGHVRLKVKIENGSVVNILVKSSDHHLLSQAAIENVKTWKFGPSTTTQFDTEFLYELVPHEVDQRHNPAVEFRLPEHVHIIATPMRSSVNY